MDAAAQANEGGGGNKPRMGSALPEKQTITMQKIAASRQFLTF